MTSDDTDQAVRLRRISYRAHHRGFKEADLLLGTFADAYLAGMSASELEAFETLLAMPDQDIYDWILGHSRPPPSVDAALMRRLQQHRPAPP